MRKDQIYYFWGFENICEIKSCLRFTVDRHFIDKLPNENRFNRHNLNVVFRMFCVKCYNKHLKSQKSTQIWIFRKFQPAVKDFLMTL